MRCCVALPPQFLSCLMRCSVLQCVAVCCSVLLCFFDSTDTEVSHESFLSVAVLQCVAVCCCALQCFALSCIVLQCLAVSCSVLQCIAVFF